MWNPQRLLDLCCEYFQTGNLTTQWNSGTSYSTATIIPRTLTCCFLSVVDYNFDVSNNHLHPNYQLISQEKFLERDNSTLSLGRIEYDVYHELLYHHSQSYSVQNCTNITRTGIEEESDQLTRGDPDFSNIEFINDIWNVKDDWEIAVKIAALVPLIILSVLGNVAVIRIVLKARLTRNPVNMFILNMSIADLLSALIFPWYFLVQDFYQAFVLGSIMCKFGGFLNALMLVSVLSLTVISYDRLTAVLFPFKKRMEPKVAKIIIYCIWIVSIAATTPIYIWRQYKERQWKDFLEAYCSEVITVLKVYWFLLIIFLVWIPLAALIVSYTAIVIKLETLEKRQKDHPVKQVKIKSKVVRMFFVVLIAYCICWIPYTSFIFIRSQNSTQTNTTAFQHLFFISHYLVYVNSAVNPIIYGLKNDNLKREFRTALPTCLKKNKRIDISMVYRQPGGNGKKQGNRNNRNVKFQNGDKLTKWMKTAETYYDKSLPSKGTVSLYSYERRNSALEDLGLPIPKISNQLQDEWNWNILN